jgi:hypothetical protein
MLKGRCSMSCYVCVCVCVCVYVQGVQVQIDSETRQYLCSCTRKASKLNGMLEGRCSMYCCVCAGIADAYREIDAIKALVRLYVLRLELRSI